MKTMSQAISKIITNAVVLIVGILCIVANKASGSTAVDAYESISIVIGSIFIVISALALILEVIVNKSLSESNEPISAGILLAAGIFFVADKYVAGNLLSYLVEYVPYALVVIGSIIAVDAILVYTVAMIKKSDRSVVVSVVELVVGLVAILFGVLAFTVDGIKNNKFMILGIILIVYAVFGILANVLAIVVSKKKTTDDTVVDAKVEVLETTTEKEEALEAKETETEE